MKKLRELFDDEIVVMVVTVAAILAAVGIPMSPIL